MRERERERDADPANARDVIKFLTGIPFFASISKIGWYRPIWPEFGAVRNAWVFGTSLCVDTIHIGQTVLAGMVQIKKHWLVLDKDKVQAS